MVQQRTVMGQVQHRPGQQVVQQPGKGGKPMKDPNAPKKPLSAYFLFSQEERLKVKAEFPDYYMTEVAKEIGRRYRSCNSTKLWATLSGITETIWTSLTSLQTSKKEKRPQYTQTTSISLFPILSRRKAEGKSRTSQLFHLWNCQEAGANMGRYEPWG